MNWRDQLSNAREADRDRREQIVSIPASHEGVGNALRCAFIPASSVLPDEFADLLAQLR